MSTKKELKEKYKTMKPLMGVFIIKNHKNKKAFVDYSKDIKSSMNRHQFQLEFGGHPLKELQKEWKEYGGDSFTFEVLEHLKYEEEGEKTDYLIELEILKMMWLEKLSEKGKLQLYK